LVALRDGERAVGMGMLVGRDSAIMSHWRTVLRVMGHPDFQGQRGGERLMRALREHATSLGLTHLQLTIRDGQRLEDFSGRFGYRVVGRHPQAIRIGPGEYRDEVMLVARANRTASNDC
jgi:GNAT superfamily N-acetyltransferase